MAATVNPSQKLEALIGKGRKVVELSNKLASKNSQLEEEIARLKQILEEERQKNAELSNKIKIIKLARSIDSGTNENPDRTELKRKINEYIREIDHCIAVLNE